MLHNRGMRFFAASFIALICVVVSPVAYAQTLSGEQGVVRFRMSPEIPGPNEPVLITVEGVGGFLGDARITWKVNGKTALSKVGGSSFSFTTGSLGTKTVVDVTIESGSKGVTSRSFSIIPSQVELLWEADTSVPDWYKGKPLYSAGSGLVVTAIPHVVINNKVIPASDLSYLWSQNGNPLSQKSGLGRSRVAIMGSQLLPSERISVEVRSGSTVVGSGEVVVSAIKPEVHLYQKDPLRGTLSDNTLSGAVSLQATEFTAEAAPYYFSKPSIEEGSVPFSWKLNNEDAVGPQTSQGLLTLRQSGAGGGRALLEVSMQNLDSDKLVQAAFSRLSIVFGSTNSNGLSSFFGL